MAYNYAWDINAPVGTAQVSDGARVVREDIKRALNERFATVYANLTDEPLKYKDQQFAADDTYAVGTTAVKPRVVFTHSLSVGVPVEPGEGNILIPNATAIQARNAAGSGNLNLVSLSAADVMTIYAGAATLTAAGVLTATTFVGAFTGNITGNVTGNVTGNATTASQLQTIRTINGVGFDGGSNIVVTAAAGTLTGTTLAANVVTSSLTSVGTLATGVWQATAVGAIYGGTGIGSYTQGDILYASAANVLAKLNIGANGTFLRSNGTIPGWSASTKPDSNRCQVTKSAFQQILDSTPTALSWDQEDYDTGGFHNNAVLNERLTIPAGGDNNQYLLIAQIEWEYDAGLPGGTRNVHIKKNGADIAKVALAPNPSENTIMQCTYLESAPAVGDYYEVYAYQTSGAALDVKTPFSLFQIVHI